MGWAMPGGLLVTDRSLGQSQRCWLFVPEMEFRRWLAAPQDPGQGIPELLQETDAGSALDRRPSSRNRNAGGRPPRADWKHFDQQTVRIVALDGGHLTRTELRRRMKAFAAENMTDPPDDRTIDKRLDVLVPDDVLAEH